MPSRIPEAMSEPKALLNRLPHERTAVRKPSSLRLYHFERRNKAPCNPVRTSRKHPLVSTYREKCTLANTQEETCQESTDEVMSDSSQDRDETPKGHTSGEVYRRFPNIIEEHVPISSRRRSQQKIRSGSRTEDPRRNLHGNIPDIKDTQDGGELVPSEAQIFLKTTQAGSTR